MKPVDQRLIDREIGDCASCVVASVLELPYEEVPLFVKDHVEKGVNWYQALWDFLKPRGLQPTSIIIGETKDPQAALRAKWAETILAHLPLPRYIEASGPSTRFENCGHAVVWDTVEGRIAHDPNPARAGLRGGPTAFMAILKTADVDEAYRAWREKVGAR